MQTTTLPIDATAQLAAAVADYEAAWRMRAALPSGIAWNAETRKHETTPEARGLDGQMRAAYQSQQDAEQQLLAAAIPAEIVYSLSAALVLATSRVSGIRHHEHPAHGGQAPADFMRRYVEESTP